MSSQQPAGLVTLGHGSLTTEALVALLRGAQVATVVDIRRYPGSRRHPHLARVALEQQLPAAGVGYRWEEDLGGRRRAPADPETDGWWQVEQFRGYASHTRSPQFARALERLLAECRAEPVAVMCSEAVWWRCHRRLVADVVALTSDIPVRHLGHDGRLREHPVADGARVVAGQVVWDRPQPGSR
ncbi:DUF488 domain-containing protein [Ornithinicoccus halotolerans]|uniref:DUF488 domain-containing protein n=1 Tax=Ornithinicoccus halotolerans TaxID=1748220 RepID=UPI001E594A03|nr:DUF488 domain-containing protein [Ornithinicoccus halotolerans]